MKDGRKYVMEETFKTKKQAENANSILWIDDYEQEIRSTEIIEVIK